MSVERTYDPTQRDQVINTLRSEILAARLKVTLDKKRNKDSSALVKKLAALKLPSLVEPQQAKPPAVGRDYIDGGGRSVTVSHSSSGSWEVASPRGGQQERTIGNVSGAHQASDRPVVERY